MKSANFEHAVESILKRDRRYEFQAYQFLKEALDFTSARIAREDSSAGGGHRHVSGLELCEGFRDLALHEYGPMASTLLQEWGIRESLDIGEMVFHLIEEQAFGKQDSDCKEDFMGVFDYEEAFVKPFEPARKRTSAISRTVSR